jgi:hypothetical protein
MIPITTVATELTEGRPHKVVETMGKHQQRSAMHIVLPDRRTETKIENTNNIGFTDIVSGHGKTKSYLHRFKLIDNPMCPRNEGAQSTEHLIYDYKILETQRKTLKHQIMTSGGTWPTINSDLVAKYTHAFSRFIRSVDFYKLQQNT